MAHYGLEVKNTKRHCFVLTSAFMNSCIQPHNQLNSSLWLIVHNAPKIGASSPLKDKLSRWQHYKCDISVYLHSSKSVALIHPRIHRIRCINPSLQPWICSLHRPTKTKDLAWLLNTGVPWKYDTEWAVYVQTGTTWQSLNAEPLSEEKNAMKCWTRNCDIVWSLKFSHLSF